MSEEVKKKITTRQKRLIQLIERRCCQQQGGSATFHSGLVRGEDAGVAAGRRADVEVELDVVLQPVASLVARHKYGPLLLLPAAAAGTQRKRADSPAHPITDSPDHDSSDSDSKPHSLIQMIVYLC